MPANSVGFVWFTGLICHILSKSKHGHAHIYKCNDCKSPSFRFLPSSKYPIPSCIYCDSTNVEQLTDERQE